MFKENLFADFVTHWLVPLLKASHAGFQVKEAPTYVVRCQSNESHV